MTRHGLATIALAAAGALAGCTVNAISPTQRSMGEVSYESAFAAAREVIRKHFELASSDPDAGVIIARPKPVRAPAERILGGASPARHVAKMHLKSRGGIVIADVSVALQRQGSAGFRQMRPGENYSTVPDQTPAQETAAITAEQDQTWRTDRYDRGMERRILNELYRALHPTKPE